MAAKKTKLGRGLDALLGGAVQFDDSSERNPESPGSDTQATPASIHTLPIDLLQRGRYQPRRDFNPDSLAELADSIRAQGVVQPIVVRKIEHDRYEIIAGERRWRASQQAGLSDIPVVVRDIDDRTAMAMALIENIQREDLNPLEEAFALQRLLKEFELTHQEIAQSVGKSRTTVTNLLRLLDLNDDVKKLVEQRRLEMGHARALLTLKDEMQSEAARKVVSAGMSVRQTEALIRNMTRPKSEPPKIQRVNPDIRRLQDRLTETLGAKVQIQDSGKGKGKLIVNYGSLEELDGILDHIN